MQAIWNDIIIAKAPRKELIYIEGNWYFPPGSVKQEYLRKNPTSLYLPLEGCLPIL
jgi:uncharacterized protein (DUF427 family)